MAITNTSSFSFRLAGDLKQEAFTILENYGFTPSQALNLFLTEIVNTKTSLTYSQMLQHLMRCKKLKAEN